MPTVVSAESYADRAIAWAKAVVAGKSGKRHGALEKQACRRFLADLKRARKRDCPFAWSAWDVDDVCGFAETMPHIKGRWDTPTISLDPVQIWILACIFGFRDARTGLRWVTRAYIEMARKNAKSTLASIISLYCLTHEDEPGPEIVIGATTGQQAGKVFEPAKEMAKRREAFRDYFGIKVWARSITCSANAGTMQPINAKSSTQDGWNPYVGILDELHAHKDRGLYDVIRSAFGARKAWLLLMITTAGYDVLGVCYEQRTLLVRILDGTAEDDRFFGVIFTLDEGDDPLDERVWPKANPLLGSAVNEAELRQYAVEAANSPASMAEFKTKRLNLWLNAAAQWLNPVDWAKCAAPLTLADFAGLECTIGSDLSDRDDITAVVLTAKRGEQYLVRPFFFLPADVLKRESQGDHGQATYAVWAGAEDREPLPPLFDDHGNALPEMPVAWLAPLLVTEGDWIDQRRVEELIRWLSTRLSVRKAVGDQFASWQTMASGLNEDFAAADNDFAVILHKSAANVTDPAKELEAAVRAGPARLLHDGNPVMAWMASNAVVTRRVDGTLIPKKPTPDSPQKIDGIDGMINSMHPLFGVEEPAPSVGIIRL